MHRVLFRTEPKLISGIEPTQSYVELFFRLRDFRGTQISQNTSKIREYGSVPKSSTSVRIRTQVDDLGTNPYRIGCGSVPKSMIWVRVGTDPYRSR
jgi:hypothetical protein